MNRIKRLLIHVPGFEPLDAGQHYKRFQRGAESASTLWGSTFTVGPFDEASASFCINASDDHWATDTDCLIVDYSAHIKNYADMPLWKRYTHGFSAFVAVIAQGGMVGYLRHAWRFGLFFLFPFVFTLMAIAATMAIAAAPIAGLGGFHALWSLPLAAAFFAFGFRPLANRLHTDLLFHDWAFAAAMAAINSQPHIALIDRLAARIEAALSKPYDEIVITAHSMGGVVAAHALGAALARNPALAPRDTPVTFAQLGGALLQSALLRNAHQLRTHVSTIAQCPNLTWLEVQCMTDPANFDKTDPLTILAVQPKPADYWRTNIRVKNLLEPSTYRRIKRDILRVHRQFVLSAERRAAYDFIPLVAGPLTPKVFLQRADIETLALAPINQDKLR